MGTAFALGYNCVAAWLGYGGDVYLVGAVIGYACYIIVTVLIDYAVAVEGILNFILGILDFEDLASEVQEQPSGDMFGDMSSAPATLAPIAPAPAVAAPSAAIISPEEAQRLMKIAEALYQKKQAEMDDALSNDKMDDFEMLENQSNELESYTKALAAITVPSPAPTAPACFDPNYVATESAPAGGDDMFGGMSSGGDMFGGMSSNGGDMFGGMSSNGDDMFGGMSSNGGDMFGGMSSGGDMFGGMSSGGDMFSGM